MGVHCSDDSEEMVIILLVGLEEVRDFCGEDYCKNSGLSTVASNWVSLSDFLSSVSQSSG